MNTIQQLYKKQFSELLKPLGFHDTGSCFARVHGEIMQSLRLEQFRGGRRCTIYFALLPMCQKIDYVDVGLYNLKSFAVQPTWQQGNSWAYDHSASSKTVCIQEMLMYTREFLLPLLEKCHDCRSTLSELIKLEALFDENRRNALRQLSMPDWVSQQDSSLHLLDGRKYYMSLKANDFVMAERIMESFLQNNIRLLQRDGPRQTEQWKLEMEKRITNEQEELQHIQAKDYAYFAPILRNNEESSIAVLKKAGIL